MTRAKGAPAKRLLACLLLAALALSVTGCGNWDETGDPLGELSQFYSKENDTKSCLSWTSTSPSGRYWPGAAPTTRRNAPTP